MPPFETRQERVKYWVTRVTFDDNGEPTIGNHVNVPGRLVDVSKSGKILTLLDQRWNKETQQQKKEVFTVEVNWNAGKSPLLDGLPLTEGVNDIKVRGKSAYYTEQWNTWRGPIVPLADTVDVRSGPRGARARGQRSEPGHPQLRRPGEDLRGFSKTSLSEHGSYGNLEEVREVNQTRFAFVSMGWRALAVLNVENRNDVFMHEFVRSNAYSHNLSISQSAGAAFMAGGYYGVETIKPHQRRELDGTRAGMNPAPTLSSGRRLLRRPVFRFSRQRGARLLVEVDRKGARHARARTNGSTRPRRRRTPGPPSRHRRHG